MYSCVLRVGNWCSVTALGHSQSVDREVGGICDFLVDFGCSVLCVHGDALRKVLDRAACIVSERSYNDQLFEPTSRAHDERDFRHAGVSRDFTLQLCDNAPYNNY